MKNVDEEAQLIELAKQFGALIRDALREMEKALPDEVRPNERQILYTRGERYDYGGIGTISIDLTIAARNRESEGDDTVQHCYAWRSNGAQVKMVLMDGAPKFFIHLNTTPQTNLLGRLPKEKEDPDYRLIWIAYTETLIAKLLAIPGMPVFILEREWVQYRDTQYTAA